MKVFLVDRSSVVLENDPRTEVPDRRGGRLARDVVYLAFLSIPLSLLITLFAGSALGGLSWVLVGGLGGVAVATFPIEQSALRRLSPFLLYLLLGAISLLWVPDLQSGVEALAQFTVVPVVYLCGWRLMSKQPAAPMELALLSLWLVPSAVLVFLRAIQQGAFQFGWLVGNAARPMVMSLALLFVVATIGRGRRFALILGSVALLTAFTLGGRMGVAVIALLMVLSPAVGLGWRWRAVLAAAGLILLGFVVQTDTFQDRFFFGREEGTLTDILLLRENVNTAGRAESWPGIIQECSNETIFGHGAGTTDSVTLRATNGRLLHPHNEFLRTFCEGGLVGTALFWSFFVAVLGRGVVLYIRHGNELGAASALLVVALFAFSLTDNIVIYTSAYMAPMAAIIGMAEQRGAVRLVSSKRLARSPRSRKVGSGLDRRDRERNSRDLR